MPKRDFHLVPHEGANVRFLKELGEFCPWTQSTHLYSSMYCVLHGNQGPGTVEEIKAHASLYATKPDLIPSTRSPVYHLVWS